MKRRDVRFRPSGLEALEALAMMSGVGAAMPEVAPASASRTALTASFHGDYATSSVPDVGTTYRLNGSGKATHLGRANVSGDLHSTGFVMNGHATGTLTLSGAKGTIRLAMTGPAQGGFATLPNRFSFVIASGTGQFAHVKGSGTAQLSLFPSLGLGSATEHGEFTLTLTSAKIGPRPKR